MRLPLAALDATTLWPFVILVVSVAFIIVAITKLRLHAFLALILAAFLAGFMTSEFKPEQISRLPAMMREDAKQNSLVAAVELTAVEFGSAAGTIALSIGLASIIGMCLMESGGADKVVRRFLGVFGEKRAGLALLASTYILSIPIFFDTMFMLMVPLAKALRMRTGKDYLLYLLCICCGGVVTHSLTVPHPGPLGMVENLRVDPGLSLVWGILGGIVPCMVGYWVACWLNRRFEVPLRETPGASLADLKGITGKADHELPSFFWSILPVILPIALISFSTLFRVGKDMPWVVSLFGGADVFAATAKVAWFIGNKNIALLIGTIIALVVLARQRGLSFAQVETLLGPPLETASVIILITAAGGAFGFMLRNAGVGDAIKAVAAGYQMNLLLLSWAVAFVIRIAQGSATVAMLTTSAMIWPMMDPATAGALPFHPMYVYLAIGFGAFACSWMNDSGFWVVNRLSGMTEQETLKSWTVMLTFVSIGGLMLTLLLAAVVPLRG